MAWNRIKTAQNLVKQNITQDSVQNVWLPPKTDSALLLEHQMEQAHSAIDRLRHASLMDTGAYHTEHDVQLSSFFILCTSLESWR